jgi:uncharacterized protein YdeI (YjbR/CyaY-like superfamily)
LATRDRRIDAYIAKAAPFAKPVLKQIRAVVHAACPDVEETLKWGHPTFMHKGMLCGMAAFKQHCALGFWKSKLILDAQGNRADESMGQFGRIFSVSDLPSRAILAGYIRKAARLNDEGVKVQKKPKPEKAPPVASADLLAALKKNAKARATFERLAPGQKRDYIEWIEESKREETRKKRLATAVEWMAEGKKRNWKYENC